MIRQNSILFCALLFLISLGSRGFDYNSSFGLQEIHQVRDLNLRPADKNLHSIVSVDNHKVRKHWIKVRYMGDGGKYIPATLPVYSSAAEFAEGIGFTGYRSFTSSNFAFLFKLRGPPSLG
jgi:hypothetical protein